jgi:mycobactin lysine-N-oxygenase
MPLDLAVIGGGPKGAAIAAKAAALRAAGYDAPAITIYEPRSLGASWSGRFGYTDGLQLLCTLAERDLGYPYDRRTFGDAVAERLFAQFSWHRFSVSAGVDESEYGNWVLRGRRPPAHRDFARYIEYAILKSQARHEARSVEQLDYNYSGQKWSLSGSGWREEFDGVVITGSIDPLPPMQNAPGNQRVVDGRSFWQSIPRISGLLQNDPDPSVVIIGAGGTGAAIAHWFIRERIDAVPITLIGREPTLHIRHVGYFEDRLFTDSLAWERLPRQSRLAFVNRVSRGVVWYNVLEALSEARNFNYESYQVLGFQPLSLPPAPGLPPGLAASLAPSNGASAAGSPLVLLDASIFVDARGFDNWWFVNNLIPTSSSLNNHLQIANHEHIIANIDESLAVGTQNGFPGRLHLPMLGHMRGPAAPNLMALGWMSDCILRPYVSGSPALASTFP